MLRIISSKHTLPGPRAENQDQVEVAEWEMLDEHKMVVAVVADGVGGEEKGRKASRIALNRLQNWITESEDTRRIPGLIRAAVEEANAVIYKESQTVPMSTTLAMAVVVQDPVGFRLFIANVGDSRIYLLRQGQLHQLTLDHIYQNRKLLPEFQDQRIEGHARNQTLMRALGLKPMVIVDQAIHVADGDRAAQRRAKDGLKLEVEDTVLVCSDGVLHPKDRSQFLLPHYKLIALLSRRNPTDLAVDLIEQSARARPGDNLSAAVLRVTNARALGSFARRRNVLSAVFIGLMVVLLLSVPGLTDLRLLLPESLSGTQTASTNTPLINFGALSLGTSSDSLNVGESFATCISSTIAGSGSYGASQIDIRQALGHLFLLWAGSDPCTEDRNDSGTRVTFEANTGSRAAVTLHHGILIAVTTRDDAEIAVRAGDYSARITGSETDSRGKLRPSCLLVQYEPDSPPDGVELLLACHHGACTYRLSSQQPQEDMAERNALIVNTNGLRSTGRAEQEEFISRIRVYQAVDQNLLRNDEVLSACNFEIPLSSPIPTPSLEAEAAPADGLEVTVTPTLTPG